MVALGSLGTLPLSGERFGAYEIVREIAHGGMAVVYLARKRFDVAGLDKLFAIKVLLPHLRDREFVGMFLDEARVAVSICHQNVVQVLDVGERDAVPYIVMEYLRGQPLRAVARRMREKPVGANDGIVFQALAQAAAGLHAAHETVRNGRPLNIVHRDVTPQNIHVGYDGSVKIVDFGIAASRGRVTATRPNVLKGTYQYLAPEQIARTRETDRRADLWALSVVAWELLVERSLFRGDDEATTLWNVINAEIPDVRTLAPRVPDQVADAIMQCLQRDPDLRPNDTRTLQQAFAGAARLAGVGTSDELAAIMRMLFAAERADDERTQRRATTGGTSDATHLTGESERRTNVAEERRSESLRAEEEPASVPAPAHVARPRRAPVIAGAIVAIAAGAIGGALAFGKLRDRSRTAVELPSAAIAEPSGPAAAAPEPPATAPAAVVPVPTPSPQPAVVEPEPAAAAADRPEPRRVTTTKPKRVRSAPSRASTVPRPTPAPPPPADAAKTTGGPLLDNPYR